MKSFLRTPRLEICDSKVESSFWEQDNVVAEVPIERVHQARQLLVGFAREGRHPIYSHPQQQS